MSQLRLSPSYYVIRMDQSRVQLRREDGHIIILETEGKATSVASLLEHLDGSRSLQEICQRLNLSLQEVEPVIAQLQEKKILETVKEGQLSYDNPLPPFFAHYAADPQALQQKLQHAVVALFGVEDLSLILLRNLAIHGIRKLHWVNSSLASQIDQDWLRRLDADIQIHLKHIDEWEQIIDTLTQNPDLMVVCQIGLDPQLEEVMNAIAMRKNFKLMRCGLLGAEGYVGPTVIPRQTACLKCYQLRVEGNVQHYEEYLTFKKHLREHRSQRPFGFSPSFLQVIAAISAWEIAKILIGSEQTLLLPLTYGRQLIINFLTMMITPHTVLKIPRCPVCGSSSQSRPIMNIWADEQESR